MDPNVSVTNINARIRNVLRGQRGNFFGQKSIKVIRIIDAPNLKYLQFDIKNKFPKLKANDLQNFGLTSLNQLDIEPFGTDLMYIRFFMTQLICLESESDVFKFNLNLVYVMMKVIAKYLN